MNKNEIRQLIKEFKKCLNNLEKVEAASIVAKVTRDRMLIEWDKTYPEYGFAKVQFILSLFLNIN